MPIIHTYDDDIESEEKNKHTIKDRKKVKTRKIVGIIAGAAVAVGFFALAPATMNVSAVGAMWVGIGSGIVTRAIVKQRQKKKMGVKKHNIVKRVLYGKNTDRPTIPDRAFLAVGIAPIAIPLIAGASPSVVPVVAGLTAYVAKRLYNFKKDKKNNKENEQSLTR